MKDLTDTVTPELSLPRRRGRPATGSAKSAAERKRLQRMRDELARNAEDATISGLCRELSRAVAAGRVQLVKIYTAQLLERAQSVVDAKVVDCQRINPVTVTKTPEPVTVTENHVVHWPMPEPVTVTENAGDDLDDWEQPAPAPVKRARPVPKYRHPATGETWSGRGKRPKWVEVYTLISGRSLDDLLL